MEPIFVLTLVIVFTGVVTGIWMAITCKQKLLKFIGAGISAANIVLFATLIKVVLIG